jgi:hypothetical protein
LFVTHAFYPSLDRALLTPNQTLDVGFRPLGRVRIQRGGILSPDLKELTEFSSNLSPESAQKCIEESLEKRRWRAYLAQIVKSFLSGGADDGSICNESIPVGSQRSGIDLLGVKHCIAECLGDFTALRGSGVE